MNTFDEIMKYCPYLKEIIEGKITEEVQARDTKIEELENTIKDLTSTILMGGK
ncbi:uncharacterized protein CBO05P1_154 [Clostridium botulinum B str. Osaka05]|uniref:Uncharacterized protein n=1 Tax=Clostridium botulinum B str. Osaka05 TaxID=1407017 RepID=A0A060N8R4_CLOBO|nr:hypothetical protein [Clostridium botulinum]BAO04873.1 uncharacterized protein CBO05P1_154 [Clostridium botulinum B str. Osaka05]